MINFKTNFEYKRPKEPSRNRHFVAGGTAYGFDFYVVNQGGWHPCAYVVLPENHVFNGVPYDDIPVECHGGLTYGEGELEGVKLEDGEYVIGWDYAHYGDYVPDASDMCGAQKWWNTTEIVNEATEVCRQLRELNDKEDKRMGLDITITIKGNSHDFRKRNWLMPFVENAIGHEVENFEEYELSKETMRDLLDRIDRVLADHDLAKELLPTQSGCFFGGTEYDHWYFEDLQDAKDQLEEDVKSMDDNDTAVFWSWW